jgi:hypothetical protein
MAVTEQMQEIELLLVLEDPPGSK